MTPTLAQALAQLMREFDALASQENRLHETDTEGYHQGKRDAYLRAQGLVDEARRKWCPNG